MRTAISRKARPLSSPGERPPGGDPAFLAPGKRKWPPTSPQLSRQQAAEDRPWIIERFATCADMIGRSTYKALVAIFNRQCEVRKGKARKGPPTFWHPGTLGGPFRLSGTVKPREHQADGTNFTFVPCRCLHAASSVAKLYSF